MTDVHSPLNSPRIVIDCAMLHETRLRHADGVMVTRHDPPVRRFFLEYSDRMGSACVWDGSSYAAAVFAAREWLDEEISIVDRVAENWRRI